MSIHPTFRQEKYGKQRTVHTRRERLEALIKKGIDIKSVYGLSKEKIIKFKIKKDKKEEKETKINPTVEWTPPTHRKKSKDIGKIK